MTTSNDLPSYLEVYDPEYRAFAHKLLHAMERAAKIEGNGRKRSQINKILCAVSRNEPPTIYSFWCAEAKALAAEWDDLRTATLEAQAEQATDVSQETPPSTTDTPATDSPTPPKPKRSYRKIEYFPGQNPFRAGSKNAKVWDLLVDGGHTREELGALSGADDKSVGYLIWLVRRSGIEVHRDPTTKTFKLTLQV